MLWSPGTQEHACGDGRCIVCPGSQAHIWMLEYTCIACSGAQMGCLAFKAAAHKLATNVLLLLLRFLLVANNCATSHLNVPADFFRSLLQFPRGSRHNLSESFNCRWKKEERREEEGEEKIPHAADWAQARCEMTVRLLHGCSCRCSSWYVSCKIQ